MAREAPVEVVDFEEQALALDLEGTEVSLAIGVVIRVKAVEGGDGVQNGDLLRAT